MGALFYFKEGIMKSRLSFLLILFLLFSLSLSSCFKVNYIYDTSESERVITEPQKETVADITEALPADTPIINEIPRNFIANKNTKKYHNEDCHYVGFMNEQNKIFIVSTPQELVAQLYEPCAFCQK